MAEDDARSPRVRLGDEPQDERQSGPEQSEQPEQRPCLERVVALRDLASRANFAGQAAESNQTTMQVLPPEAQLATAVVAGSQLVASALYFCTLALCERIDQEDAVSLIEEIKGQIQKQVN